MKSDWLAASTFERTQELLSAVNTLSIHSKLVLADIDDPTSEPDLIAARKCVGGFLEHLQTLVDDSRRNQDGTVMGADPQLGDLAMRYLSADKRGARRVGATLRSYSLPDAVALVESERREDIPALVDYLRDLRALLEEYAYHDIGTFEEGQ